MKIIIEGKSGSGKTELAKHLCRQFERVVCIDVLGQFDGVIIEKPLKLKEFLEINAMKKFTVSYRSKCISSDDLIEEFEFINREIIHKCFNICYVVDEVDNYATSYKIPPYFNGLIQRGRHKNISIIATTRRHAETSRMLTAQADHIFTFKQIEKNDLNTLKTYFGERTAEIIELKQYEYMHYDSNAQKIYRYIPLKIR